MAHMSKFKKKRSIVGLRGKNVISTYVDARSEEVELQRLMNHVLISFSHLCLVFINEYLKVFLF